MCRYADKHIITRKFSYSIVTIGFDIVYMPPELAILLSIFK